MLMKILLLFTISFIVNPAWAQPMRESLDAVVKKLEADSQLRHAIVGFYVADTKTGLPVYEHNAQVGLAPASTQKLFTSGAAFDLLGNGYTYKTRLAFFQTGTKGGKPEGLIVIIGAGDPTLGSWRYATTQIDSILSSWTKAIKNFSINKRATGILVDDNSPGGRLSVPVGYIWEDMGNYYGAGTTITNWSENQYDVFFRSGVKGKPAVVTNVSPAQAQVKFYNEITSGEEGSGDNAFIFCAPYSTEAYMKGTIPPGKTAFSISGSMPDPAWTLGFDLQQRLLKEGIAIDSLFTARKYTGSYHAAAASDEVENTTHYSPPLDSIIYWFLKRSINLYGEALARTISKEKNGVYDLDSGVNIIRDFWSRHGIEKSAINIRDGSGLSPQNRVTTDALVKVLQYAKTRPWFGSFYYALPEYNGMKMKSGSIGGARAFAGYHTSKNGKEYTYAIIVNNYNGSASQVVKKLYAVLDILK
jgi:D-alanyl-D-alanine carboxypeptidase/D-alanyl-D-alanine-endopeptidase (penicillin-binding protein 4)